MGSVFKAIDQNLRRLVALKILKKEFSADEGERKRLETEARLTASINHPHVVKLYSFGQDHGQFYMAMELVEKGSLDDLITLQQKVPEAQVLEVGIQIAQGLEAALHRGLIHRDIKPGNILFADAHTAKIVDFGLATPVSEEATSGDIWGTPYYIAPEKLNNQPEDFRSDMYSLGASLFHALAGRPPFEAQTASLVALKHIKNQAVSLQAFAPHVSSETAYVINRTLSKNPDDRYASYAEFIEHLQYARAKLLEHAGRPRQQTKRVVVESQHQRQFVGLISILLLLAALGIGGTLFVLRDKLFVESNPFHEVDTESVDEGASISEDAWASARTAIIDQNYDEALALLRELADTRGLVPPQKFWIQTQMGLALLLSGEVEEAERAFKPLDKPTPFSTRPEDSQLAQFFMNLGQTMSNTHPIPPKVSRDYSGDNFEALALLLFGLKNWSMGKFDDARPFFQAFVDAHPQGRETAWIKEYEPLATAHLSDYTAYRKVRDLVDQATDADTISHALTELESSRNSLQTGTRITEEFENLEKTLHDKEQQ